MGIVFENDGVIDERLIKTFGVSVKESENPIGFFGTGLKYAIAILARYRQSVLILSGDKALTFQIKKTTIRGKDFEFITMNGEELPFTTELGKNWQLWQAFRELYCNCLDEGGQVYTETGGIKGSQNRTQIIVEGEEFETIYRDRHAFILPKMSAELKLASGGVEVYNRPSQALFYRGIRVMTLDKPALFTYNILEKLELTEDRTVMYARSALTKPSLGISQMTDREHLQRALTASEKHFEHDILFDDFLFMFSEPTPEFLDVAGKEFHMNNDKLNMSARSYMKKKLNKPSTKNYEESPLNEVQSKQLLRCQNIVNRIYPDFGNYPIMVVNDLGTETLAVADRVLRKIIVSKRCFDLGTKYLLSTLIEEYAHLKTGHLDMTRPLQTWLFDQICTLIENHVLKEPV